MGFAIDHVVIAVADLDRAIADYRRLGFTVEEGGEHPGRGSKNALVVFADGSYFELIAFGRPTPDFRWWRVLDQSGPGLVDFALLPNDIDRDVAAAQARGLDFEAPVDGGRARPDGERLVWKTARSPQSDTPFFCGDVTPRALRVPEGAVRTHANNAQGIGTVVVAVLNLERSIARYAALFDEPPAATYALPGLGIRVAHLGAGRGSITLATPSGKGEASDAIAAHLEKRGEGPFSVGLTGAAGALDRALSHGALLDFIGSAQS
ncbi:VOC family protein [Rhodopseudomonas sp.]|uniref:VOC family protein n=1 Tax=Rhodopseudomonas sp. TaxID=1078 RepID=UPI003B3BD359